MIRIQEDYEMYFMLIAIPLGFLVFLMFEKLNNTKVMGAVALVYVFGALGGFGEPVRTSLLGHILIFAAVAMFVMVYKLVEKIKERKKGKQDSELRE